MIRCHSRLPLVGDRSRDLVRLANPKIKTFLREKNSGGLSASRASRWSALEPHNIIGKETQRPITSPPASGSSFDENMLGPV
jgi:hypothetical protein